MGPSPVTSRLLAIGPPVTSLSLGLGLFGRRPRSAVLAVFLGHSNRRFAGSGCRFVGLRGLFLLFGCRCLLLCGLITCGCRLPSVWGCSSWGRLMLQTNGAEAGANRALCCRASAARRSNVAFCWRASVAREAGKRTDTSGEGEGGGEPCLPPACASPYSLACHSTE